MLILPGHKGRLRSIAFSHDGRFLASCAGGGTAVSLWDTATGKRLGFLGGHVLRVTCLAFSPGPDNVLVSSAGSDPIHMWDAVSGNQVASLGNSLGTASCLAFSPDASILAVTFKSWSMYSIAWTKPTLAEWDSQGPLHGSTMNAFSLAFVQGGRVLAVGHDRGIDWWDYGTRKWEARSGESAPVRALVCSSDGHTLAYSAREKVTLWDTNTRQPRLVLKGHERLVNSLAFSPDNRTLASGSSDGTVRLWDVESGRERAAFDWQLGRVWTVAFAADGMRAAAGGDRGKLILWDVDS